MDNFVHIALGANHNYINGLLVTLISIIRSASDKQRLRFHVFSDGLLPEDIALVKSLAAEYGVTELEFLHPDMGNVASHFSETKNYKLTAYLRLFYCEILKDLDWIVYTDVDTLWLRDVCELWNLRDNSASVLWCQDLPSICHGVSLYHQQWNPDFVESNYCCSGVMLMNLKRLREMDFIKDSIEFVAKWGTPYFVDQDILNHVCRDSAKLLPQHWDCLMPTHEATHGLVYHFTGIGKLFNAPFNSWRPLYYPWYRFFYNFVKKTPDRPVCNRFKRLAFWLLGSFYPNRRLISLLTLGKLGIIDSFQRQLFFAWLWRHAEWKKLLAN